MVDERSAYLPPEKHDHWGEETGYRRLHWAAITCLVLAFSSPLGLFYTGFIALPVVSVILGWKAHRDIAKKPEIYAGRAFATIGLFISVVLGTWATYGKSNESDYLYYQAAEQTKHWLGYLKEGKLGHAHQVMLSIEGGRNFEVRDIEEFYQNDRGMLEEQNARFSRQPMKMMLDHIDRWNPDDLVVIKDVLIKNVKRNERQIVQEYMLPLNGSQQEAIGFRIQYWRRFFPEGRASHWQLEGIGMLDGTYGEDAGDPHAGHNH